MPKPVPRPLLVVRKYLYNETRPESPQLRDFGSNLLPGRSDLSGVRRNLLTFIFYSIEVAIGDFEAG